MGWFSVGKTPSSSRDWSKLVPKWFSEREDPRTEVCLFLRRLLREKRTCSWFLLYRDGFCPGKPSKIASIRRIRHSEFIVGVWTSFGLLSRATTMAIQTFMLDSERHGHIWQSDMGLRNNGRRGQCWRLLRHSWSDSNFSFLTGMDRWESYGTYSHQRTVCIMVFIVLVALTRYLSWIVRVLACSDNRNHQQSSDLYQE